MMGRGGERKHMIWFCVTFIVGTKHKLSTLGAVDVSRKHMLWFYRYVYEKTRHKVLKLFLIFQYNALCHPMTTVVLA